MISLAQFLFGPPRIELEDEPVKINRRKAIGLMAYLSLNPERHSRNTLATLFWPEADQSRARAALRRVLATLKQAGLGPWLKIERETIKLNPSPDFWVDVLEFRQRLSDCLAASDQEDEVCISLLSQAVQLACGEFMAGFTLPDSPAFDEWQLAQAENLRRDLTSALARLVRSHSQLGAYDTAIRYARQWIELDPIYELAHRQLIHLYAYSGQRSAALRQYWNCVQVLNQELGVSPSAETTALYERIQAGTEASASDSQPALFQLNPTPASLTYSPPPLHNFPAQPTPFIGRQEELSDISRRLLDDNCRLLTLSGIGGIGKTRLAIQTAVMQAGAFPDGVYYVPLVSVSSADFFLPALADILALSLDREESVKPRLLNHLKDKRLLLILDNFEHLMDALDYVTEILAQALRLKILITSQERLNLQGEWTVEIKGMAYPSDKTDVGEIEGYGAVALFLHRAYRVNSTFTLTEADKPHLARICTLIDGIPLGIELAASWVRVLSCQEIADEIERMVNTQENLDFLSTSLHDVPQRHRNLREVFEYSWQLLSPAEQIALCRASVFQGGCRREALEAVTGADLLLISALVDKSLLNRTTSGRYEMHMLLRQFAAEKLRQVADEAEQTRDKFCDYYIAFLNARETELRGPRQQETLAEIAREIENIRVSWRWAIIRNKAAAIEEAMECLWFFYAMYGWFREGAEMFERAVVTFRKRGGSPHEALADPLQADLLAKLGWFYLRQGQYERAKTVLEESLSRSTGPKNEQRAAPLHFLGLLAGQVGDLAQAVENLQASLNLYRDSGNRWGTTWVLSHLAYHLSQFDPARRAEATAMLQESLSIYKAIGNRQGMAIALNSLGYIFSQQGDYLAARKLLEESLAIRRAIGFPRGIAVTLNNLGLVTMALDDLDASQKYYEESLELALDVDALPQALAALTGVAGILARVGQSFQAVEMLTVVLNHPASNEETRQRAKKTLKNLGANSTARPIEASAETFETIVAGILQRTMSEQAN